LIPLLRASDHFKRFHTAKVESGCTKYGYAGWVLILIRPVAHENAVPYKGTEARYRWQPTLDHERCDPHTVRVDHRCRVNV
jgi:hypothetical protein